MNYIVFDLEWNQCPGGKTKENPRLPFEIIEIGAIKLNENREEVSTFHEVIRPLVYHHLHYRMKEVVPVSEEELRTARTFSRVIRDFLKWCGPEEYTFVIWGGLDVTELQRNMDYYRIENPFKKPLLYYDLQKLYSLIYFDGKKRLALEEAASAMEIPESMPFHRALDDAYYTAEIMKRLDISEVSQYYSVDYYRLPVTESEELHLDFGTYTKYVSREFPDRDSALADKNVMSLRCPKCRLPVWKRLRWFSAGGSIYLGLSQCPRHGYVKGKIRIKRSCSDSIFIVKTIKLADDSSVEYIKGKKELILEKRRRLRAKQYQKKHARNNPDIRT